MGFSPDPNNDPELEEPEREEIVIPNDFSAVRKPEGIILKKLEKHKYSKDAIFAVRLAFQEAMSNAMRHGNGEDPNKKVIVGIAVDDKQAVIEVQDEGPGFEPDCVPDPTLPDRISLPRGRGIMLIHAYMTRVEYNKSGNRIRMIRVNE